MILRRIVKNVRARDWFTVAIEFLIVVVGIFVGLEVSNWNEERKLAAQERSYLEQIRDEIADNMTAVEYQSRYVEAVVAAGQRALAFLESDGDCADDCADLLIDFFHASQVWGTGYLMAAFREAERLGFPTDRTVRDTVQAFYFLLDGWDAVNAFAPAYRENVRGHIPPRAFVSLWRDCHGIPGGRLEQLTRDCVEDLRELDLEGELREIHADPALASQLRFWLGQNISAATFHQSMQDHGEAAITAIDHELAGGG